MGEKSDILVSVVDLGEGPVPPLILAKNNKNNEKTQKEEKPAGQAMFANQFCFNISKKPDTHLSSRSGSATGSPTTPLAEPESCGPMPL